MCLDESILGGVLRIGGVAGDQVGGAEGELLVRADERGERRSVAAACLSTRSKSVGGLSATVSGTPAGAARFPLSGVEGMAENHDRCEIAVALRSLDASEYGSAAQVGHSLVGSIR